ncbi:hypothetical protein VR010_15115 [Actinomycetaceae bacterium L2_0104]
MTTNADSPGRAFYKGFDKDMQCRGFQYVEGETYEQEQEAVLCGSGFHACALPLDVLTYYPLRDGNQYRVVDIEDFTEESGGDSKVAARKITVGASANVFGLVKAHVEAIWNRVTDEADASEGVKATTGRWANAATTGYGAHAATTGYGAHAATTGYGAHAATTGYGAHAATTGDRANAATTGRWANAATTGRWANAATTGYGAHAATTGRWANAATTGDRAHAATTGDRANAATTGYGAHAVTTGDRANAATTGYGAHAAANVTDPNAIAAVLGIGKAKGPTGSWLVLTERDSNLTVLGVQAIKVDGDTIKPDTYYTLKNGEVMEAILNA